MPFVTVADIKAHLNITEDTDDALLGDKIEAAEAWVASFTGADFTDAETFPDGPPAPVKEAIRKFVADLYECRESNRDGIAAPYGVAELLAPYRGWAF